ncbi:PP2C family protein-serine/threonine phosphatase [Acidicapsa ligni]|uniref:PP2C family protein-serine/threonine phosphatase n=1 Tax=Acidicapsa ligni TaxID=542300 RepID=UPI0021E01217|nr:PP2C family protein-serine/threonine phosphatase [Acidicapsa ligni]
MKRSYRGTVGPNGVEKLLPAFATALVAALVTILTLSAAAPSAYAASSVAEFDATHLSQPTNLSGTWLVQAGDNPAFAQPAFDDSQWIPFNPNRSLRTIFPDSSPEVVWYRQRIKVSPTQTGLGLEERTLSNAFEVYVNGERLMVSGQVAPFHAYTMDARVLSSIPDAQLASGSLLVAVRVHIAKNEWAGTNPGLFAANLTLGQTTTLYREGWLAVIGENFFIWLDLALNVGLGLVALVLFAAQRRQFEYLWIAALGMIRLAEFPIQVSSLFYNIPIAWPIVAGCFRIASPLVWVSMYFAFVEIRIGWKFRSFLIFAGLLNAYSTLGEYLPSLPGSYQLLENLLFVALLSIVVPVVLAIHWRRGNREAGILLIPVIQFSLYIYANYTLALLFRIPAWNAAALRGLNLIQRYPAGPFSISLDNVSGIFCTLSLAIIMLRRSSSVSRHQALLEGELAAAREVQQVILPENFEAIPGFFIESVYDPAQQVGGDFFQILPAANDGLMLVLGDVAGKGLPAAMLVSVLVGAIHTVADYTHAPDEMLAKLNERLIGRSNGGFSTALAAHITADGEVTIANAGHLSPYLDGVELPLPGALPLGIVSNVSYETTHFQLAPGSRLTFYSDGVIEAQNEDGELLGFNRAQQLSTEPADAIAKAAQQFGQSDDITVVAITRIAATAAAAA